MTSPDSTAAAPAPSGRQYLAAGAMAPTVASLSTAYAMAVEKSATILAQPDVGLSLIQTFPEDLALVRAHVTAFRGDVTLGARVLAAFTAVTDIAESVTNQATDLLATAGRLDATDVESDEHRRDLAAFRAVLDALRVRTTALDPDENSAALPLVEAYSALTAFAAGPLADDGARFLAATKAVTAADVVAQLELQISALQAQIDGLNHDVAQGATSQILDSIFFGFSIAESVASAETEPGSAVLGVGFAIKDEVDKESAFADEMRRKNEQINELIGQYRSLVEGLVAARQEMAVLITVGGHTDGFRAAVTEAAQAVKSLLGQVQLLAHGIDALSLVDVADTADFFSGQLDSAISAWGSVAEACTGQLQLARSLG